MINLDQSLNLQYKEHGTTTLDLFQETILGFLDNLKRNHTRITRNTDIISSVVREDINQAYIKDILNGLSVNQNQAEHQILDFEGKEVLSTITNYSFISKSDWGKIASIGSKLREGESDNEILLVNSMDSDFYFVFISPIYYSLSVEGILISFEEADFSSIFRGYLKQSHRLVVLSNNEGLIIQTFGNPDIASSLFDIQFVDKLDNIDLNLTLKLNSSIVSKSQRDLFLQNMAILFAFMVAALFLLRKAGINLIVNPQIALSREKDRAENAEKVKGEFLANMSHEIRTPMNGILGMIDLLKETDVNKTQQHYLDIIAGSGEALLTIINDILDLSKIRKWQTSPR